MLHNMLKNALLIINFTIFLASCTSLKEDINYNKNNMLEKIKAVDDNYFIFKKLLLSLIHI